MAGGQVSGQCIRAARLRAGLTQAQLARAANTSERNIVRWENNQHAPRLEHIAAIASATGKELEFFLTGTPADDEEESRGVASFNRDLIRQLHDALGVALGVDA